MSNQDVINFGGHIYDFQKSVESFRLAVFHQRDLLSVQVQLAGMIAENQSRANRGMAPAYDESAFMELRKVL